MIELFTKKIFIVDKKFLDNLESRSQSDFEIFTDCQLDTKIITLPMGLENQKALINLTDPSNITSGQVLVRDNYSNSFIKMDDYSEDNFIQKSRIWILFCNALGAKSVSINNVEKDFIETDLLDRNSLNLSVETNSLGVDSNLDYKNHTQDYFHKVQNKIMKMSSTSEGANPDFTEARKIMNKYNLNKDDMFINMFEMRELKSNNIKTHFFNIDFSKDIKKVFDSSFEFKLDFMLNKYFSSDFEVERIKKIQIKSKINLNITGVVEF